MFPKLLVYLTTITVLLLPTSSLLADEFQRATVYRTLGCMVGVDCIASGDATLVRNNRGVELNLVSTSFEPNALYTVWWVIFNKPHKCATPNQCMGPDLFVPAVKGVVRWAAAYTTDSGGIGSVTAHLGEGDISADTPPPWMESNLGLKNAKRAEIHVVTRTHGTQLGDGYDQLFNYLGGCDMNACLDDQFAVFPVPAGDDDDD